MSSECTEVSTHAHTVERPLGKHKECSYRAEVTHSTALMDPARNVLCAAAG